MNKARKIAVGEYAYRGYRIVNGYTVLGDKAWMIEHPTMGGTMHSEKSLSMCQYFIDNKITSDAVWNTLRESGRKYDLAKLSDDQRVYYDEAISCGASHNDAMEAAETNGYAR